MDIIVDGYNLMHAAGLAKTSYGPRGLQKARHLLILRIKQGFQEAELAKVLVVFDAKEAPAETAEELLDQGVRIRFALPGTEADELIEELVSQHSAPRQLLVVSSDHRLQRAARRRNAAFTDSDLFLDDLARRQKQSELEKRRQAPSKKLAEPQVSVEEWLQEFGDINVHELSHEVEAESTKGPAKSLPPADTQQSASKRSTGPVDPAQSGQRPRTTRNATPPEVQTEIEPPASTLPDELQFWQDRIDELFDDKRA